MKYYFSVLFDVCTAEDSKTEEQSATEHRQAEVIETVVVGGGAQCFPSLENYFSRNAQKQPVAVSKQNVAVVLCVFFFPLLQSVYIGILNIFFHNV